VLFVEKNYIVKTEKSQETLLQDGWERCTHCSMFYRPTGEVGNCPERMGERHMSENSASYWLLCSASEQELVCNGSD
jgi:hypothetical protein